MIKTFSAATKYFHIKNKPISIDNAAFKCHYRITFLILLVATILVTSRYFKSVNLSLIKHY